MNAHKRVCGIDPGLDGGLTTLSQESGSIAKVESIIMPTLGGSKGKRMLSLKDIQSFLRETSPELVVIELVGARPGQGVSSMYTFGYGCGLIEAMVFSLGIQYEFVSPQKWQKHCFVGIPRTIDKPSQIFCQRTFPNADWRGTERSRTPHDGKTDSCCLAYYGLTEHLKTHGGT